MSDAWVMYHVGRGARELLAPPPAKAGGGWEGVPTVRADPKGTPPQPSPAFAGEGAEARGFRRSYGDAGSADACSSKPARRSASIRGCRLEAGDRKSTRLNSSH